MDAEGIPFKVKYQTFLQNIRLEALTYVIRHEKEHEGRNGERKLLPAADENTVYIKKIITHEKLLVRELN